MTYAVELKPRAVKDLRRVGKRDASRILNALDRLKDNLTGDVKKLTDATSEYRLRVGQFRMLFEIEEQSRIVVYRVVHRREAYR